nr:PQQ-dependent sugar dehydrogenase [Flavobacterium sp. B17]
MKINKFYISAVSLFLIFSSCKKNKLNAQQIGNDGSVETKEPNSPEYKPAFAGQTRIKAVKTSTPYKVEVLSSDLGKPWGIINLPDGRLLITDKRGYMNIVSTDGKQISKIDGFPKVDSKGQGGMLDVALDPDFSQTILSTSVFQNLMKKEIILLLRKVNCLRI